MSIKRYWKALLVALFLVSQVACCGLAIRKPPAEIYLLQPKEEKFPPYEGNKPRIDLPNKLGPQVWLYKT